MFKRILAPLASLRITVVLLVVGMVLIFAGTLALREQGIWAVQEHYFHSWGFWLPLQNLLPFVKRHIPGSIPFVGGYTLIALLLTNLLSAHVARFKFNWKRTGIILIHFSLILLLMGELVSALFRVESQMRIDEGQTVRYSYDTREFELAVVDISPSDHDNVAVISERRLRAAGSGPIQDPRLPFDVKLVKYYTNSDIAGPVQPGGEALATAGSMKALKVVGLPPVSGTDSDHVDMPSAFVALSKGGKELGTYLASVQTRPEQVEVDGKVYELALRFKRLYKPYGVTLIKFSHDRFVGTDMARNFSALIRLQDPRNSENRQVLIKMNSPLRYGGETFYQASFDKASDKTTILEVVDNPGWLVPYAACVIGAIGMMFHFGLALFNFLRKRSKEAAGVAATSPRAGALAGGGSGKGGKKADKGAGRRPAEAETYTLRPSSGPASAAFLVPALIGAICLITVAWQLRPARVSEKWNFESFGELPVNFEGRVMPIDSLARNSLKVLSGRESIQETIVDGDQVKHRTIPAIEWLTEVLSSTERAETIESVRIDNTEVRGLLGLPDERSLPNGKREARSLYSPAEVRPKFQELQAELTRADGTPKDTRSAYQTQVLILGRHLMLYSRLAQLASLYVVPPLEKGQEWRTFAEVVDETRRKMQENPSAAAERDPAAVAFIEMIQAYHEGNADEFNTSVANYHRMVDQKLPQVTGKAEFETFFNRFAPLYLAMVLYLTAFILVALSWLGWSRPLSRGALVVTVIALIVHTFGLASRMYICGRPPVTNLYSAAVFIAFGGVVMCLLLERVFRNTIGLTVAGIIGFAPLLVAGGIAYSDAVNKSEADTMAQLQAVLDTNFWLATHVVAITIGYLTTFVAGLLGIIYVVRGVFTSTLTAAERKNLSRMAYGTVCFAMVFSFVGTILGGIWADQSWGRFWGWDPKENGAILLVLWNAVILHARWGGVIRERGLMLLAIVGNVVTAWSMFGTNMLGVGLHSYGFMEYALPYLGGFVASQLLLLAIGNLPLASWKSFAGDLARG